VLMGYGGQTLRDAEERLEAVYAKGFLPFAMLYRDVRDEWEWSAEWKALQKKWCRPAAYRAKPIANSTEELFQEGNPQ